MTEIIKLNRNLHVVYAAKQIKFLLLSDLHWDNPKCKRDILKAHLDKAVETGAKIIVNGDFFCLMQGKYDPRRSKKDILPEHNKANYLDAVIVDAVEWFTPYKDNLLLVGYGNHETAIIKACETDPLQRFVDLFNMTHNANVEIGGYGGVIDVKMRKNETSDRSNFTIRYYHGYGGGGAVTKGVIQDQRQMAMWEGYNLTWQGHVHELYHHVNPVEFYDRNMKRIKIRNVHQLRTASYKEEYEDGFGGFHIERGRPPKPIGGYWLDLEIVKNKDGLKVIPDFRLCI